MFLSWYLNSLVNLIVANYFDNTACLMHVYDRDTDFLYLTEPHYLTENVDKFKLDPHQKCRNFILLCNNAAYAFTKVETVIKYDSNGMYNSRRYLIIINNNDAFEEFFNSTLLTFVCNILIIYAPKEDFLNDTTNKLIPEENQGVFTLYTHRYIGVEGNNDPILLDIWYSVNQTFEYGNKLYPDKITNQMGRGLRIGCIDNLPFANCIFEKPDEYGSEQHVIMKFAEKYNYTIHFISNDTSRGGGMIWQNGTGYGIRGMLINDVDYLDLIYGGFPKVHHIDMIRSVTYTYEVSVPLPTVKYGFLWVFNVYPTTVWVLLILAFISLYLVIHLRRFLFGKDPTYTSEVQAIALFGVFVNQPVIPSQEVKSSSVLKFMCLVMLFSSILLTAGYNSGLSSVMVKPEYENDIKTLAECAESDLQLLFFDRYYKVLQADTRKIYRQLYQKIYLLERINNTNDYQKSERLLSSGKYAVARYRRSTIGYYEHYEHLVQMYGRYKPITPELFTDYYYLLLRKNSMHTMQLTELLQTAIESGLMTFWEQDALRIEGNTTFQWKIHDFKMNNANKILNMSNLKGCFGFWLICMGLSTMVFLWEVYRKSAQKLYL